MPFKFSGFCTISGYSLDLKRFDGGVFKLLTGTILIQIELKFRFLGGAKMNRDRQPWNNKVNPFNIFALFPFLFSVSVLFSIFITDKCVFYLLDIQ